jgi:polyvinyl alcohol dehydrogenase (cytochrome)
VAKFGFSATPLVVDNALIAATLDGKIVVFESASGRVLKTIDTMGEIPSINGIPGKGGSIDAHAISAGGGTIFVTSGYASFNQTPENVLIALRPRD